MDNDLTMLKSKLKEIKILYEQTVKNGGRNGVHSLIRSQKLIGIIHDYIKQELISYGISKDKIFPRLNETKPELRMSGFLKEKKQDISIISGKFKKETIKEGVLIGKTDKIGKDIINMSISINVRSQLSSLGKNFDTLYERTFAEALNLHLRTNKLIMGEVYMIPLVAYDPEKMAKKEVGWKEKAPIKYIPAFRELTKRESADIDEYKYERVCLLIVDFREDNPKIISSAQELLDLGWIKKDEIDNFSLEGLGMKGFIKDLVMAYEKRQGNLNPLR